MGREGAARGEGRGRSSRRGRRTAAAAEVHKGCSDQPSPQCVSGVGAVRVTVVLLPRARYASKASPPFVVIACTWRHYRVGESRALLERRSGKRAEAPRVTSAVLETRYAM